AAAALALIWANSPWSQSYEALWQVRPGLGVAGLIPPQDLRFWVNDGLMSVFFLVVGLEIRREMHQGVLSDLKVATLPIVVAAGVMAVLLLQWLGVRAALAYLLPGAVVWIGMLRAGLHPTLAGVLLGLITPASSEFGRRGAPPAPQRADSPLVRLEARLHPWVAFAIMPLFAMANAGVSLTGVASGAAASQA